MASSDARRPKWLDFLSRWRWEFALAGGILITVAILGAAEWGHNRTMTTLKKSDVEDAKSLGALRLMSHMMIAEAAHRGYLLSPLDAYLVNYEKAVKDATAQLAAIAKLYQITGGEASALRISRIATMIGERQGIMSVTLRHAKAGEMDEALKLFNSDLNRFKIVALRQEIDALLDENKRFLASLTADAVSVSRNSRLTIALVTAVNIILLVVVFRQLGEAFRKKEQETKELVQQREWLDQQVQERTQQLKQLSIHHQDMLEAEKIRLARELHDELGSILTATKMDVAWVRSHMHSNPAAMHEKLALILDSLDQGIMVKRRLIEDLRPSTLSSFGLVVAARELVEEHAQRNEWQATIDLPDAEPDIDEDTATALYRILQETLTNSAKYAKAHSVQVNLECSDQALKMDIADDGVGFRMRDVRRSALGILGMRQRVEARGGSLHVISSPDKGCRVTATMPLKPREHCVSGSDSASSASASASASASVSASVTPISRTG